METGKLTAPTTTLQQRLQRATSYVWNLDRRALAWLQAHGRKPGTPTKIMLLAAKLVVVTALFATAVALVVLVSALAMAVAVFWVLGKSRALHRYDDNDTAAPTFNGLQLRQGHSGYAYYDSAGHRVIHYPED
ncbi:MAG: DUF3742 family protein [Pseudomonadales bacterium]|jgi:Flp pilus assembly protein TadB|nr:DUF3742 family protein [Pseudomonadales bacterium]